MPIKFENSIPLEQGTVIDTANSKFTDFKGAININDWLLAGMQWGSNNHGVHYYNVFRDDDASCVALRVRGNQASDDTYTQFEDLIENISGAVLISNFLVQPGRTEVRFKYDGPVGPIISMWCYVEDSQGDNQEIDFELGTSYSGETVTDFSTISISTWKGLSQTTCKKIKLNKSLNDGEFHTLGWDWYYTDTTKKIVYYIDNVVIGEINNFVPNIQNRLWFGGWIPNQGNPVPNFDEAYIFVDYISYKPFLNQIVEQYASPTPSSARDYQYPLTSKTLTIPQYIVKVNGVLNFKINNKKVKHVNGKLLDTSLDKDVTVVSTLVGS